MVTGVLFQFSGEKDSHNGGHLPVAGSDTIS
jgi:hypothetical protein